MDREEARSLLTEKLAEYRKLSYAEIVANIDDDGYKSTSRGDAGASGCAPWIPMR